MKGSVVLVLFMLVGILLMGNIYTVGASEIYKNDAGGIFNGGENIASITLNPPLNLSSVPFQINWVSNSGCAVWGLVPEIEKFVLVFILLCTLLILPIQ